MKIKSYLKGIGFWMVTLTLTLSPCLVHAACEIVGTIDGGYIVSCSGTDTDGFCIGDGNDIITVELGADVSNAVQQFVEEVASANAIAIDAGGGNNQVTNYGSVGATAEANALPEDGSASQATANATGISAGDGADVIKNFSTIAATATSNSESGDISLTLGGNTQSQSMTTSTATATGIDGGSGKNQVINTGAITTIATSEADASSINVDMGDSGGADVRTIANAIAAGISGGNDEDEIITREGTITVNAAANVDSANTLVTIDVAKESLATGSSLSDASVTADAVATGIYGGEGDDTIINDETEITADADAHATAVGVSLTISGSLEGNSEGKALSDSSTTANAKATGIDGGGGNDAIENGGKIFANADSTVTAAEVGVNIEVTKGGDASGAALSDASVAASAAATGIDGGEGNDTIKNQGDIGLTADAGATGVSVALDVAGTMKGNAAGSSVSDSSTTAQAVVTGISGGAGDDTIINDSLATTTNADASATGVSVGLTVSGSMKGNAEGKALSDAKVTANAVATGIDGGSGQDSIDNWSKLSSEVDASATGVAASLKVGFTKEGDVSPDAVAEGSALSDASVTASAAATGIDGGEGSDAINNRGDIDLLANSGATGVSVSVDVAGTMKGKAGGSSVSNSSVTAKSSAVGIEGGEGDDTITNTGKITLMKQAEGIDPTDASATAVSVGLTVTGSMEGSVEGRALSDASALADASATGISGGAGIDAITSSGAIVAEVDSKATAVGVSVGVTLSKEGSASGAALSDASVTANAAATGIDGGEGNDTIENRGDIGLSADAKATGVSVSVDVAGSMKGETKGEAQSDASVTAKSTAVGIGGGEGDDTITNEASATTTNANASAIGVSVGLTVSGSMEGNVSGKTLSDASVTAEASATGIDGGIGRDTIDNRSKLSSEVDASATGVAASLKVGFTKEGDVSPDAVAEGSALSDASVTASASATGIDGGGDNDTINNRGDIALLANSSATGVSVSVDVAGTMKGKAAGSSVSDSSVTAKSSAIGIDGGEGDDTIDNTGKITLMKQAEGVDPTDASATAVSVGLTVTGSMEGSVEGKALSDASAVADAAATGISGGAGIDAITNSGAIVAEVDSKATAVGVSVGVTLSKEGSASGAALSDASVTANAAATGIDGGEDKDEIDNQGDIELQANSSATGVSVALDVAGTMKGNAAGSSVSDSSTTAQAVVTGISGGAGDDTIINDSLATTTNADANATGVSVGLTVSGSMKGNAEGKALSDAKVTANAAATGIDGGSGQDSIDNWSKLSSEVDASATGVAASLKVGFTKEGDVSPDAVAEGSALSDASVTANASATGIDGGEDSDTISNRGDIELLANSSATGVSVALDVAGTMKGNAGGSSASNSSVTAKSTAVGIDGGEGDDTIDNEGSITLMKQGVGEDQTDASATAVSVGLTVSGSMEGNVEGKALSDASALADASATGIRGGLGVDKITNRGAIAANVDSSATAVGVSVNIGLTKEGNASGAALSDASVTANAAATGIDGGEDKDEIDNQGDIELQANSSATGVSVALDVAGTMKGNAAGSSVSDSSTTAQAVVTGISGGAGDDTIINDSLATTTNANASAIGVSVGLTVSGSMKGNVSGKALSDAKVTAEAAATGIDGGSGRDSIDNWSNLSSDVDASATGVAVSLKVGFSKEGDVSPDAVAEGSALSDASVTASASATGIDGGGDNDTINNRGDIALLANSSATGVSVALDVAGTMKGKAAGSSVSDSSVTAKSTAIGIEGGEGDDTITNTGKITLMKQAEGIDPTDASATAVSVGLTVTGSMEGNVEGRALSDASALADAAATGISGGAGIDAITNSGAIVAEVDSKATSVGVSVGVTLSKEGSASGAALSNASVTASAAATGIDGGEGKDEIGNRGDIELLAKSDATGVSVSVTVAGTMKGDAKGKAQSDASVTAKSTAVGIEGGEGDDTITNEGAITLMNGSGDDAIDAKALGVAVSLDITGSMNGAAEGQALSKATTTAKAAATGISGGSGVDDITNTAAITADVDSQAKGVAVAANVSVSGNGVAEGGSLSDVSTVAKAEATGIDGGEEDDTIDNSGEIQLLSNADATSTAVSVTVSGTMRGQASGEALSKASTTADAVAIGIAGGEGSDEIINRAGISANANSKAKTVGVTVGITVASEGIAEGASLSDSSSVSSAGATGIDGGGGDDIIDNKGAITLLSSSDARATGVSVGLAGAMKGMAEGKAVADSSAQAISQSIGIDGGEGNDRISSSANPITTFAKSLSDAESVSVQGTGAVGMAKGAAIADSSASSVSYSAGIDGGLGNDTIENASEIKATAKADAEASSTTVGVTIGIGAAETIGTGNSSATARVNSTGIEGGEGNDRITNTAKITTGGLENLGPMANAQAGATTVTVGIAAGLNMGEASSNAAALAEANAAGISSGSGDDWIYNTGDITVGSDPMGTGNMASASAKSTTVKVDVTLGASLGESFSDTSSTAVANLAGIRSGSGDDWVYNTGAITVGTDPYEPGKTASMATANAASETVGVNVTIGGSFSDASSNASATAQSTSTGIETDVGNDWIDNTGVISAFSSSEAVGLGKTTAASLTVGASEGSAQSNASSLSTAFATGIDSGGDDDEISTDSDVVVKARATSTTLSQAKNYNILSVGSALQSADANSSSTAEAIARGIYGGSGADNITAGGVLDITADTEVKSTSRSSTVTGVSIGSNVQEARSRAGTVSNALAIGIDGGEGNDVIKSTATLTVNTFSNADTTATSSSNTGFNIAGTSSGESVAGATSDVTATGIGIRGGVSVLAVNESDADVIINEGPISVTTTVSAKTQSTSTADSITFIGAAEGTAISDASAKVLADGIGIDGGADNDTIINKNTISVKTTADASVTSTSNVNSYATFGGASSMGVSDASANVLAEATGISGGSGDDVITSLGPVTVEAESIGSVTSNSYVDAAVTFGGASSKAASDASATKKAIARGIDGGDGDDVITNYDDLTVSAISAGTVTSESRAKAKATFGSTHSLTTTAAALEGAVDAAGIIGGSGDDWIKNLGNVNSTAHADLTVNSLSMATAKSTFGSSDARAFSVSTAQGKASSVGISGDDGKDLIENEGVVNASAIANTNLKSATVAIAHSTFGGEFTVAASTNYAAGESTSKGITAGAGNDEIINKGLVTVEAGGTVKVDSLTVSSDGPAYSDAGTLALAYARGVDGGAGDDSILNTDTVFVKAKPRISSATRTFGSGGNVDGKVGILLNGTATGITGGEGNDKISNEGNALVLVGVQETGSTVSESAVSGSTTFTDKSFTTLGDPQELVGKWIRITGGENPDFFTQVVAFDPQTGTFTLRDPLKYDLLTGTAYTLYDYGVKEPDITSLNVTVGGRTRVDASTTASVQAKGIVGGDGDDHIVNAGTTAVSASNLVKTVTLNVTRNIRADTRIESNVNAVGIEGNDQSSVTDVSDGGTKVFTDLSRKGEDPDAIVGKAVLFKSGASEDFATRVEAFDPDTGTFTLADPLPSGGLLRNDVYTLGGGSDSITNLGAIDVRADSAIDASSWSLSFGSADIEGIGRAQALSAGMRSGEFGDFLENYGNVSTLSTADVSSTDRVYVALGSAEQKLSFEASSKSVGVDADAGNDEFINGENSSINAEAASKADVNGVTATFLAEVKNSVNAIADSTALGLDLGQGNNVAYNEGEFRVSANAITNAQAVSERVYIPIFGFLNETNADADAIAKASAWGIRAGSGEDQVFNRDLIQVDASADATSFAQGSKVGSEDDTSTVTKDSDKGSKTFVDASLKGQDPADLKDKWVRFLTGQNEDFFTRIVGFDPSTGTITIFDELPGDLKAEVLGKDKDGNVIVITPADEYTFSAARNGTSASVASALATGIDLGDGNAIVENTGVIRVKASAKADTTAKTFGGQVTAQANSSSEARGIRTGTGDDVIRNAGVIDVESKVVTTTSGGSATEIATATGIDAGNGNNKITNEGLINVTASVAQPNGKATARGIITGEGDDTIINSGQIISSTVINGTREPGIGIATGAGNDMVTLDQGTLVEGSINLGEGNDTLAFTGSPVVIGEVTGESGTDALIFNGAGSIGFGVSDFESATKKGPGTFTVAGLTTMQRVEVDEGTLEINNDYQLAKGGTFQTKVYGGGDSGQLKINGEAGLAGTLKVVKGPGAYVNGTKYNVLVADTTTDWFSDEIMPEPTALVSFRANGYPDRVEVEPLVKSFTTVANNRVHATIGQYMDRILPTASGDLSYVLGEFQNLSGQQFNTAFSSLSPDSYDNYTRGTLFTAQQYTKSLQYRMNNVRSHFWVGSPDNEKPILLAYSGSEASLGQLFTPGEFSQIQGKSGLWLDAFGQWGDQDEEDGYTGYDYFMRGATLGFDHRMMDNLMAGLSLGYSRSDIDLDRNQGSGDVKSLFGSLYGSYFDKHLYIDAILSYGRNWYDNSRIITIGGISRKASSEHDAHLFSAYLGGGYYFDFNPWAFGPYGSLQYIRLDEESFEEKGAGGISLRVDDRQTDSLTSELGLRMVRLFKGKCGNFVPEINLAWSYDFDIDDHVVKASFAGSPGASFSIKGQDVERNGLILGAGLTFIHKSGFSTSFRYKGDFRGDYKSNAIMGELRFSF